MSEDIFAGVEQPALDHLTDKIAAVFIATEALIAHQLADDDTICPKILSAALMKAHLLGAASVIVHPHTDEEQDAILVAGASEFLGATVAQIRREK